jgi:tripartite motif-containing protein 71
MMRQNPKYRDMNTVLFFIPIFVLIALIFVPQIALSEQSKFVSKWGSYGTADGQFKTPSGIAIDTSGNVYVADVLNHRIQKFTNDGRFITKWGSYGTADGQFLGPSGITIDASGNVYVADSTGNRIQKFTNDGRFITKWGSLGDKPGQLNEPLGVTIDPSSNIYVTDSMNGRIQVFSNNGTFLTTWNTVTKNENPTIVPRGIVIDPSGKIYVSTVDESNDTKDEIRVYNNNGTLLMKWGSRCFISTGFPCNPTGGLHSGQIGNGLFYAPTGLASDSKGNIYVADTTNNRIQVFSNNGTFITKWGTSGIGDGQFHNPRWVAVNDKSGQIYLSDSGNNRIQLFAKPTVLVVKSR